jgi:hypothetical protein
MIHPKTRRKQKYDFTEVHGCFYAQLLDACIAFLQSRPAQFLRATCRVVLGAFACQLSARTRKPHQASACVREGWRGYVARLHTISLIRLFTFPGITYNLAKKGKMFGFRTQPVKEVNE